MNLAFSSSLAILLGVLLPVLTLVRAWTIGDSNVAAFFADLICGGMLLLGAVKTRERAHSGQRFLTAAYGLTFGVFLSNLIGYLQPQSELASHPERPDLDEWMVVPSIAGLLVAGVGLLISLRSIRSQ